MQRLFKFLIVCTLGTLVLTQAPIFNETGKELTHDEDIDSIHIYINSTALDNAVNDVLKFKKLYLEKTKDEREQLRWAIANAYENAKAKAILNFGDTIVPILKKWGKIA